MPKVIISDTSCFIILEKIGYLDILHRLFGEVVTTAEVAAEFGLPLPAWVEVKQPSDFSTQKSLERSVDQGEASTMALALEHEESLLILDDLKARKLAQHLGLATTGTFGILVEAKLAGIISSVKPPIARIRQTNFRLSDELEKIILAKAQE